ncbi:hypothetical protein [Neobacillus mesonae]|uniref:hypothetical protein n=1 Tax=Neobacillus mesonae TaxID=1193713 RepID=UPI00203FA1A5|nr:hypothetical protein [Neobacillus mesonae]MCM3568877.1 hypothetical protein [Neobacillus mesonae]
MSLKNFFILFRKNETENEIRKKLSILELNIKELEEALHGLKNQNQNQNEPEQDAKTKDAPIIIEKINIEKIILDKYELNNNFGQLGIKELKGKLNIGATYGSEFTPKMDEEDIEKQEKEKREKKEESPAEDRQGPKINFKSNKKD